MAVAANKRSVMTLFSGPTDIYSHQVRIVLAEKGVSFEIEHVEKDNPPQDLIDLNPNQSVPTLVDRELTLWESRIIMEYLDERFPHPPLMPVYPVARGESRLYMQRIEKDWYSLMNTIQSGTAAQADAARKQLREETAGHRAGLHPETLLPERRVQPGGLLPGAAAVAFAGSRCGTGWRRRERAQRLHDSRI